MDKMVDNMSLCYILILKSSSSGMAGLAVTYGLNMNNRLSRWILSFCKLENKIISIERIHQYCHIPNEAPSVIEDSRPPSSWPENGTIQLIDLRVFHFFYLFTFQFIYFYMSSSKFKHTYNCILLIV